MATVACTSPAGQDLFHPGKKTGPLLACIPNMETGAKGGDGTPPGRPSFPVSEGELAALYYSRELGLPTLEPAFAAKATEKVPSPVGIPRLP